MTKLKICETLAALAWDPDPRFVHSTWLAVVSSVAKTAEAKNIEVHRRMPDDGQRVIKAPTTVSC
jgi:hypothetical protein